MADANAKVAVSERKSASNYSDARATDEIIEELAEDYAKYLDLNIEKEKLQVDESIEEMLTRLDEFCGLIDLIRSDTSLCINETIPQIQVKSAQLQLMFQKIDKLEEFVNIVKANLAVMEEEVNKAEDEMGSFSSIKKMFTSIQLPSFMRKSSTPPRRPEPKPKFEPPAIFNSDDYFGPQPKKRSKSQTGRRASLERPRSRSEPRASGSDSGVEVATEAGNEIAPP